MTQHVGENDDAALRRRKPHKGPQARRRDLMIANGIRRISNHIHVLVRMRGVLARPPPQIVERRVVGDAKHPALRVFNRSSARQGFDRLHQRFLDHVLAVDDRAGHARTVAVQLRPQFGEYPVEMRTVGRRIRHW
jgi:hypothetical protein